MDDFDTFVDFSDIYGKEVQMVYRLFLVNCYLLHVPRLSSEPAIKIEMVLTGLTVHNND